MTRIGSAWVTALVFSVACGFARGASDAEGFEVGDELAPAVMEPVAAPVAAPTALGAEAATPPAASPPASVGGYELPPEGDPSAAAAAAEDEELERSLESPTRSVEAYEEARREALHRFTLPDWSINLTIEPKAFEATDFRVGVTNELKNEANASVFGVLLSGERVLARRIGLLSVGLEAGIYGSNTKEKFGNMMPAIVAAGPLIHYQANFLRRQWVVPAVRLEYEFVRYSFSFNNRSARDFRALPRADLGAMIFLNVIEPAAAGEIYMNYGIKRTYLAIYYSLANDMSAREINLTERAWRGVLRFEY